MAILLILCKDIILLSWSFILVPPSSSSSSAVNIYRKMPRKIPNILTLSTHGNVYQGHAADFLLRMTTHSPERSSKDNEDNSLKDEDSKRFDELRRNILLSPLLLSILIPKDSAHADENLLELDQKKIVMQMSSENIPKKYVSTSSSSSSSTKNCQSSSVSSCSTSSSSSTSSGTSSGATEQDALTEAELRRIAVFEKAAPSVVYIDTFVEQRDAFSTNVMEVPIGTGSGFVWDDRGHIVTNCKC
jgi:hypothetical protein